jgi:hypothetical protein
LGPRLWLSPPKLTELPTVSLRIACPSCSTRVVVADASAGCTVACPRCKQRFVVEGDASPIQQSPSQVVSEEDVLPPPTDEPGISRRSRSAEESPEQRSGLPDQGRGSGLAAWLKGPLDAKRVALLVGSGLVVGLLLCAGPLTVVGFLVGVSVSRDVSKHETLSTSPPKTTPT